MTVAEVALLSKCWCFTGSNAQSAIIYLLNQIAGGTMTPAEVAVNSKCWCFTGSEFEKAASYLLDQIVEGGGGGGGSDPVDNQALGGVTPVSSTKNFVFDTDTGFLWYSSTKAAPWNNV